MKRGVACANLGLCAALTRRSKDAKVQKLDKVSCRLAHRGCRAGGRSGLTRAQRGSCAGKKLRNATKKLNTRLYGGGHHQKPQWVTMETLRCVVAQALTGEQPFFF